MPLHSSFVSVNGSQQDLKSFDCGKEAMNTFLSRYAGRHMAQGLSTTWVLPDARKGVLPGKDGRALVAAYFTLSQHCVEKEALPTTKSLPRYPIPVALLARLAVDVNYQGKGLGSKTLVTALRKACYLCSVGLPAIGLVLDVLDEDAMSFYNSYDFFEPMKDNPNRLFIGMDSIRDL